MTKPLPAELLRSRRSQTGRPCLLCQRRHEIDDYACKVTRGDGLGRHYETQGYFCNDCWTQVQQAVAASRGARTSGGQQPGARVSPAGDYG